MFSDSVLALKTGHLTYHKLLAETPHLSPTLSFGQYVFTEEQFGLCHDTILSSRRTKRGKHLCLIKKKIKSEHCMLLVLCKKKTSEALKFSTEPRARCHHRNSYEARYKK